MAVVDLSQNVEEISHLHFFSIKKSFVLKSISDMTFALKILILYNFSAQRKICLKHIPDITYTLKIYDIVSQYKEIFF